MWHAFLQLVEKTCGRTHRPLFSALWSSRIDLIWIKKSYRVHRDKKKAAEKSAAFKSFQIKIGLEGITKPKLHPARVALNCVKNIPKDIKTLRVYRCRGGFDVFG